MLALPSPVVGQSITVVEKASHTPGLLRFELNRPLSGMGHERYSPAAPIEGDRPVDELARRLIGHGGVDAVHVNGSMVTVTLARGSTGAGLADIVRNLFRYYPDSDGTAVAPPVDAADADAPAADAPAADAGAPAAEAAE